MWPEIVLAKSECRHEIILTGPSINDRIVKEGLDKNLFTLTALNYLNIHGTELKEIPEDIKDLTGLQTLVLHSNKFTSVTSAVGKLNKLKVLDLSDNNIGEIPDFFASFEHLITINLSRNKLTNFPPLRNNAKLSVLDISNNKLTEFPDVCSTDLSNLSEIKLNGNEITTIPNEIYQLALLKILDVSSNKITTLPGNLIDCSKLKEINLKQNPISDRRLLKLIDQCRTKQILDYVKQHCPKSNTNVDSNKKVGKKNRQHSESISEETVDNKEEFKYKINVLYAKEQCEVRITKNVENIRKYIVCCVVQGLSFSEESFKKFIQLQNKLHETICDKRNSGTIATHDFKKLGDGHLIYTTKKPTDLKMKPLNRVTEITGKELFDKLQVEAQNLRKEKKRNTYSGIHKYLYLLEGKPEYPCLLNSKGEVISFPPIVNSETSKIEVTSTDIFLEVTSSISLHICKKIMDTLLKEMVLLLEKDLNVLQIKTTDEDGHLKNVYPSKTDLKFEGEQLIQIVKE